MSVGFAFRRRGKELDEPVCTVRIKLQARTGSPPEQAASLLAGSQEKLKTLLHDGVVNSLGSGFQVADVQVLDQTAEIFIRVVSCGSITIAYTTLSGALDLLVSHIRSLVAREVVGQFPVTVSVRWSPEPALVRMKLKEPNEKGTISKIVQQPLGVLLIGTLLGSLLIPQLNDISNRRKLRHEERVKVALMIIEQSHETDRRLYNLMDYLVLFRKDHDDPAMSAAFLKEEQRTARKTFNDMYLAFNAQAWWWHWNVKSESSLSAIATTAESKEIGELAQQYSEALGECTKAVSTLWAPFLKKPFKPDNPENDALIDAARENLTKARTRRNQLAIQMAKVFASQ